MSPCSLQGLQKHNNYEYTIKLHYLVYLISANRLSVVNKLVPALNGSCTGKTELVVMRC